MFDARSSHGFASGPQPWFPVARGQKLPEPPVAVRTRFRPPAEDDRGCPETDLRS